MGKIVIYSVFLAEELPSISALVPDPRSIVWTKFSNQKRASREYSFRYKIWIRTVVYVESNTVWAERGFNG
jgi:hypothetical protein